MNWYKLNPLTDHCACFGVWGGSITLLCLGQCVSSWARENEAYLRKPSSCPPSVVLTSSWWSLIQRNRNSSSSNPNKTSILMCSAIWWKKSTGSSSSTSLTPMKTSMPSSLRSQILPLSCPMTQAMIQMTRYVLKLRMRTQTLPCSRSEERNVTRKNRNFTLRS